MDMQVFQIESHKALLKEGRVLISSPFMKDPFFSRAVVLIVSHGLNGSMGLVMNKSFKDAVLLNDLMPELKSAPPIPLYLGGPLDWNTMFFVHKMKNLEGAFDLGNGLFLNGDFSVVQQYILDRRPTEGFLRFFSGYAGWGTGQLLSEMDEKSWVVGKAESKALLSANPSKLWRNTLDKMGGKYALWAHYPQYPSMN